MRPMESDGIQDRFKPRENRNLSERKPGSPASDCVPLHKGIPYAPKELAVVVKTIVEDSQSYADVVARGELSSQLKGEIAERCVEKALTKFGKTRKLEVTRDQGNHTADFKVELKQDLKVGKLHFKPGDTVIVEVKMGAPKTIRDKLRTPESQGRKQMIETNQRENAQGAVCIVPREMQNSQNRVFIEEVKADMAMNPQESNTTILMALPHEGAMKKAVLLSST